MIGKVKFFNEEKGFGFIIGDEEKEYFVHISQIENNEQLKADDSVSFTPGRNERGDHAKKVFKE